MYDGNISEAAFFSSLGVFALFMLIISLTFYIVSALSLMRIAENRGSDKGWMAWVPIVNSFLVPLLIQDESQVHESLRGKLVLAYGVTLALVFIPVVGLLSSLVNVLLYFYSLYILFNLYTKNAVAYLVIAILTGGMAMPFLFFRIRNREPIA